MSKKDYDKAASIINELFIFKSLDQTTKNKLKVAASWKHFRNGDVIINEGEDGQFLFVIHAGKVEVSTTMKGSDVQLAELGPGAIFGEVAVITGASRTSSVVAVENVEALAFPAKLIRDIATRNPKIKEVIRRVIEGRARMAISASSPARR